MTGIKLELKLGELVALRSGGPPLTVVGFGASSSIPGGDLVSCGWFHEGEYRTVNLPRAALVPAEAKSSGGANITG